MAVLYSDGVVYEHHGNAWAQVEGLNLYTNRIVDIAITGSGLPHGDRDVLLMVSTEGKLIVSCCSALRLLA